MNEQKTNKRRTNDEQKTNNERRKDKAKVEIRRRLLVEFILQRRRVYEDGVVLCAKAVVFRYLNNNFKLIKRLEYSI